MVTPSHAQFEPRSVTTREEGGVPQGELHDRGRRRIFLEAFLVAAGGLLLLIPYYRLPVTNADEGIIALGAERILRGQVPYRDFFTELGPASFYLHALIFKLASIDLMSLRLTAWLLGGATSGLLYVLARKILRPWWAVAATAAFPLVCYPLVYRVSHHWWGIAFHILTVLALGASLDPAPGAKGGSRVTWCGLAGTLAGVTLLSMQTTGFWAIFMGLVFLMCEPWLTARNVETKIHYPLPCHLQPGFKFLGYRKGQRARAWIVRQRIGDMESGEVAFASRKRWFKQIARIDRALSLACADNCVHFVDE